MCDQLCAETININISILARVQSWYESDAGYDEYSLLYSTRDFFSLLVPYSEILLLGRVASNGNKSSNVKKLDVDNKPVMFSCII